MLILYILVGVVLLLFLSDWLHRARVRNARSSGLYPLEGTGTDADIERLILSRNKLLAIKLYRELYGGDLKSAKEAVEEITQRIAR